MAEFKLRPLQALRRHGLWLTALLTVALFFGLFLLADADAVWASLSSLDAPTFVAVVGLVSFGYAIRFLKWAYYLRVLDLTVSLPTNLLVFTSGLMFVVTPVKVGELWKAWFLRDLNDIPVERSTPVVGAERVTDLLSLTGLSFLGVIVYQRTVVTVIAVAGVFLAGIVILQWRTVCLSVVDRCRSLPVIGSRAAELERFYEDAYALFRPVPLTIALGLSLLAWATEGIALWLVLQRLGTGAPVVVGLFVFGFGSVVGAISLLPGGLGAAEVSMVGALIALGYPRPLSVSATLVIRFGTLWYGALLGLTTFGLYRFHYWITQHGGSECTREG